MDTRRVQALYVMMPCQKVNANELNLQHLTSEYETHEITELKSLELSTSPEVGSQIETV